METNNQIQFQMRITSINVLRFSVHELSGLKSVGGDIFEYQSDFEVKILEESNEIGIEMTVSIRVRETGELFSDLKILMKFEFLPYDQVVIKKKDKTFNIPHAVIGNLFHITAGTIRGILYERLKGTISPIEIFPLLDINQMFADRDLKNTPKVYPPDQVHNS